ncbi:Flagellar basal-body rod protein FlgF [Candidatus Rhodobacter oscarellae]|uniref:Flagellar basal-body rod protein FlgF n=1 Tax=Candidatus Rhodobacter oscarellae TaxID=1675527 RepID=A0A0J9E9B0_9RHOB|nr:DUF1217 domain-containing protein [Candidatus Rhodobacter lobularis]KMW59216.1 Flagellar basal-body rod protein FlgF [Candidatus Rhodobacter lobularis]
MTYQPVVPLSGFAGWTFLQRTRESQQEAFENSQLIQRNTTYFEENIGEIKTAEALVDDRRLLEVALGAFGLDEDINNKFFIQKILEDGTLDPDSLGNRLSDKRYFAMAEAFGFGDFPIPNTELSDFPQEITSLYKERQFEVAVGNADTNMRLALSLDRELDTLLEESTTDDGRWFLVMGQPPVRQVFETALGLPSSFGSLDIDLQLTGFRDAASQRFGDAEVSQFADPEKREELIRLFLVRSEIAAGTASITGASAALTLLQNANIGGGLFG